MPNIVFASSKGGAGKTTACVALACELARQGESQNINIGIVDADPNQHTGAWAKLPGKPSNITMYPDVTESTILDTIEEAQSKCHFVLIDLEGVSSNAVTFATSQADLVIIPCQPSQNDANEAVKTIKMVKNSARMLKHEIPTSILFTRISAAITTKTAKYLAHEFKKKGIDVIDIALIDREAFKSIFSFGGSINDLDTGSPASIQKTASNTKAFAEAVKKRLARSGEVA